MGNSIVDIDEFVHNLEQQFQNPIPGGLHPETIFRDLEEWTSLQALIVISSFDWDYGIIISAAELQQANTVGDLFELVSQKTGNNGNSEHT